MSHASRGQIAERPEPARWVVLGVFGATVLYLAFQLVVYHRLSTETYPTLLMPGFEYSGSVDGGVKTARTELEVRFTDGVERYGMRDLADATGMGYRAYFMLGWAYRPVSKDWDDAVPEAVEPKPATGALALIRRVYPTFRRDLISLAADPERAAWLRSVVGVLAPGREPIEAVFIRTPVTVFGFGEDRREEVGQPGYHRVLFRKGS